MAFLQKTWKDRVAEYINRRVLTKEDGTTELVSVERSEGTISQEGDAFSAANMNDLEQRIANEFSEQNKNLTTSDNLKFRFATDGEGNYGYLAADDSFVPFKKSGSLKVKVTSGEKYADTTLACNIDDLIIISTFSHITTVNGATKLGEQSIGNGGVTHYESIYKATSKTVTLDFVDSKPSCWFVVG